MKTKIKQLFIIILAGFLLFHPVGYTYAEDVPPTPPTAPATPQNHEMPPAPPSQPQQQPPSQPSPSQNDVSNTTKDQLMKEALQKSNQQVHDDPSSQTNGSQTTDPIGGNVGNTQVSSGNANTQAQSLTNTNANNVQTSLPSTQPGTTTTNLGNGAGSNNNFSSSTDTAKTTNQNNAAQVDNNLTQSSVTGNNNASLNVGNSNLTTGDANVSGTAITSVNTNVDGLAVNEFNIADDHKGDIILNFNGANCIAGCGVDAPNIIRNNGNGANSNNTANTTNNSSSSTFQNNDATVGNTLTLSADSGHNAANMNTGGDTNIQTGDANVSANSITMANNNIDGKVVYSVVNIYGNLTGDIIMPQSAIDAVSAGCSSCGGASENIDNGSGSNNTVSNTNNTSDQTFQNNDATIGNNLILNAETGHNTEDNNTGGDATVQTGSTQTNARVLNVANTNVDGGNMWLVIINEAGKWIGKILGAPDLAHTAASEGTTLQVDDNGNVTASNGGNGAGTTNTAQASINNNTTTTQSNKADVQNTLKLTANTGDNDASNNTNGNTSIKTGDAKIIANLVNFVNNNIKSGGKLFVTVVNVFGKWIGDFVPAGQHKRTTQLAQTTQATTQISPTPTQTVALINAADTTQMESLTPSYYARQVRYYTIYNGKNNTTSNNYPREGVPASNLLASVDTRNIGAGSIAVAGAKDNTTIHINLAWLLIILPLLMTAIKFRRYLSLYK